MDMLQIWQPWWNGPMSWRIQSDSQRKKQFEYISVKEIVPVAHNYPT